MNKKLSLGVCISLIAIACAVTFVLTMSTFQSMFNQRISAVQQREEMYAKLQEMDTYVRNNYIDNIDDSSLLNNTMNGYMNGIGDIYGRYMTADDYYLSLQDSKGTFIGIGASVKKDESGYIKVAKVYENSPAAEAGILENDLITTVDGSKVLEIGADNAIKLLPVEEGKKVVLTVQRNGENLNFQLVSTQIKITSVTGKIINNYGYIRISSFNELTAEQFINMIDDFLSKDVNGFVFDVRNNGGGSVDVLSKMLNRIIGEAVIATAEYRDGSVKPLIETTNDKSVNLPMVVLADKGTASAAELFAVALRDFKATQIIGTNTYGKAIMQHTNVFKDGSAVVLSVAKVYAAKSENYNGVGIKPDYLVEITNSPDFNPIILEESADSQLLKAFEVIEALKQTQ